MSKLKNTLLARKSQIEKQLKTYRELLDELAEVNKAIAALDPPRLSCGPCCSGCSECRGGLAYR